MILRSSANNLSRLEYDGDKYKIEHFHRIDENVLRDNAELRKDKRACWSADKEMRLFARIPTLTYISWMKKYPELRDSDPAYRDRFLKKLLEQPENEVFKTVENI